PVFEVRRGCPVQRVGDHKAPVCNRRPLRLLESRRRPSRARLGPRVEGSELRGHSDGPSLEAARDDGYGNHTDRVAGKTIDPRTRGRREATGQLGFREYRGVRGPALDGRRHVEICEGKRRAGRPAERRARDVARVLASGPAEGRRDRPLLGSIPGKECPTDDLAQRTDWRLPPPLPLLLPPRP